jgi:hypothetical protein
MGRIRSLPQTDGRVVMGAASMGSVRPIGPAVPAMKRARPDAPSATVTGLILLAALPLFAQVFYYLIDVGPFYYLSKAWPVLSLPLAIYGAILLRAPLHGLCAVMLAYMLGVTPLLSILWLGNSFSDAVITTVKVWPILYYFAVLAFLALRRPAPRTIETTLIQLGIATFAALWLLWLLVPASWYAIEPIDSKLFMHEFERGYRIAMPMTFGVLLIFYIAQLMAERPRLWHAAAIVAMFGTMILIQKQRTVIAAAMLVMLWILLQRLPRLLRSFLLIAVLIGAAGAAWWITVHGQVAQSLGASLAIRQDSIARAWAFLLDNPLRWLFGTGGTTRFGSASLSELLGSREFYLADIGWLGVLFEYGVIGTALLAGFYLASLRADGGFAPVDPERPAMPRALGSYCLFLVISTAIYSAVFTPGEIATVVALMLYLHGRWWRLGESPLDRHARSDRAPAQTLPDAR